MKPFLFVLFLLPILSYAGNFGKLEKKRLSYSVTYEKDTSLKKGKAKVTFVCDLCKNSDTKKRALKYGMNGSSQKCTMNSEGSYSYITKSNKSVFKFYYSPDYLEITTDSIQLKAGMNTIITLYFELAGYEVEDDKPVIYLYPEIQTNVSVIVSPVGKMTFTYPEYTGVWNVTAQPNGDLDINGKSYRYLFWEATQLLPDPFSDDCGFIVKKENTVAFLEEKLTALGLNTIEQTDFITYWGPRLTAHDQCKVKFVINEQCDQFAELNISPKPDHVNRVYIVWSAARENEQLSGQQLPTLNRDGFDALEWGGSEIPVNFQFHASTR